MTVKKNLFAKYTPISEYQLSLSLRMRLILLRPR